MALMSMKTMLLRARAGGYAVGYFEAFNMDALLAIAEAAERKRAPVIIGFGGQFLSSPKREAPEDVYVYGALAAAVAKRSSVPMAVLLNEANILDEIYRGLGAGYNAVMYQKANEAPEETLRLTREICHVAHAMNIDVESELGELPSADIASGARTQGSYTGVAQAKAYVRETGIDALAVSVGNVHLLEDGKASIDHERLAQLIDAVDVPIVLHGGTGIAEDDLRRAIERGVSKINVGTVLKRAYIGAVSNFCREHSLERVDPHATIGWGGEADMLSIGRAAIAREVEQLMDVFGCAEKAGGDGNA